MNLFAFYTTAAILILVMWMGFDKITNAIYSLREEKLK